MAFRVLLLLALTIVTAVPGRAAEPIRYEVDLSAAASQLVRISMHVPLEGRESVTVALPAWRPGKYLILDPAQTIRRLEARSGAGEPLGAEKLTKSTWRIDAAGADEDGEVVVEYEIYANSVNDRTRHADDTHAFLSGSAMFLYDTDNLDRPVRVRFVNVPEGWRIASGLDAAADEPRTLVAPDYHTLVDSPIEVGVHERLEFDLAGKTHEIVIWGEAEFDAEKLTEDVAAIVDEQREIFGFLPYERYLFIMHVASGLGGGTEHLNSTVLHLRRASLEDPNAYERFLGLVSHEMFHTWNVKQLRPAGLTPYDYQKENYTTLLWVAEGTTSYYDDLTLARAELVEQDDYLDMLAETIGDLRDHPGAALQSLEASSFDAWIKFNRSSPDDVNSTVNFYSKGALVSFLLDLRLRQLTDGQITLDEVMREMVERFPLEEGGFTRDDLVSTLERLSGELFDGFFERFVAGTEPLPFEEAVGVVGLELLFEEEEREEDETGPVDEGGRPVTPTLGVRVRDDGGRAVVRSVRSDGPAHQAGVIHADEIVAIDGRRVTAETFDDVVESLTPGDQIDLQLFRRDQLRTIPVLVAARPAGEWKLQRLEDPEDAQIRAYESWLGPWPEEST